MGRSFRPRGGKGPSPPAASKSQQELDEMVRRMKAEQAADVSYRERSLKLHVV